MIESYPKIWQPKHRAASQVFNKGHVVVQEKVDGSQISFEVKEGDLFIRSKGQDIDPSAPDKLFKNAVDAILARRAFMVPDHIYRGEYLSKPKHNVIAYDDVPKNHIILFDIQGPNGEYLSPPGVKAHADFLEMPVVPTFREWMIEDVMEWPKDLDTLLGKESVLGGSKIEGYVIKNYNQITPFGQPTFVKVVRSEFKEEHRRSWGVSTDKVEDIGKRFNTFARFEKAVQHLRDEGKLTETNADIGLLFQEVARDFEAEEIDAVKGALWKIYGKKVIKGVQRGLPEWYKSRLGTPVATSADQSQPSPHGSSQPTSSEE